MTACQDDLLLSQVLRAQMCASCVSATLVVYAIMLPRAMLCVPLKGQDLGSCLSHVRGGGGSVVTVGSFCNGPLPLQEHLMASLVCPIV